jgi:hypothetical protein
MRDAQTIQTKSGRGARRSAPALALLTLTIAAVTASSAEAIPAFARRYQFSCSTCHAPVPRLKPFGEAFAARGFRLEDPSQEPPRATYDTGDPTLRLLRELPLAVRLEGYGSFKDDVKATSDVEWPWAAKILSGGPLHDKISYYLYFILEKGGIEGLEDAYLQFNEPLKLPINLMAGQFQVCDPLFKRELRLERFDYEIFKVKVGASPVALTYDRGVVASWTLPAGIESVFQLVNGNGIHRADDEDGFDEDGLKNVSLRFARTFEKKVRIGLFTYWGRTTGGDAENRTYYVGPDLVVNFSERVQLNAQYLERRDDDPLFAGSTGEDWKTRGGFAELLYLPRGQDGPYAIAMLYNNVKSDDPLARRESVSGTLSYLFARNVRGILEAGRDIANESGRASIGIMAAF